ncbi:MAG: site-specific DNA-methyltransferase [Polyangiaceae bacterium]
MVESRSRAAGKRRRGRSKRLGADQVEVTWPGKAPLLDVPDAPMASETDLQVLEHLGAPTSGRRLTPSLLVQGDNLLAMQALAPKLEGEVQLVYIDPPYATGLSYFTSTRVGDDAVERRAYRDQQVGGLPGYLAAMRERLVMIHRLLRDDGVLFLHCDWRANAALRLLLDEIFGPDAFRNEIIWRRAPNLGRQAASKQLGRVVDSIYVYSKTPGSELRGPVPRRRSLVELDRKGKPKGTRWDERHQAYFTTAPRGDYTDKSIEALRAEGRVYDAPSGKVYIKYFLTKGEDGQWYKEQPVDTLWDDFEVRPLRHRPKAEDMGYDTQKPEGLLERIIGWGSAPGDIVADFYGGSGTTAAVAERMGRAWVSCDLGQAAILIQRRRLLRLGAAFDVCAVKHAEVRRWWARHETPEAAVEQVLMAFGAEPEAGTRGRRDGARVVVGDEALTTSEAIERACEEARAAGEGALTFLAWAWAPGDAAALRERWARAGLKLEQRTIPRELLGPGPHRALVFVERPEVDLAVVSAAEGRKLRLDALRGGATAGCSEDWTELVAGWMVSWTKDRGGAGFAPTWQAHRVDGEPLPLESPIFEATAVRVKVLTVFGDAIERRLEA